MITPFSQTFFNRPDYPRIEKMWYYRQLGEPYQSIGKRFGVSHQTVRNLLKKREASLRWFESRQKCSLDRTERQRGPISAISLNRTEYRSEGYTIP